MKKLLVAIITMMLVVTMGACNKQVFDTTLKFDKAIVALPDGQIVRGKVDSWTDYEDGDQIQVKVEGITYLVHSSQIVLITE